ncbi:HTH-type transcriptional repressor AcnR [Thalassovita gelatinovora]|uniref:HTH-type transcriptional repressor AcnR n=1 Tax=Thalassovita gelatinovora TaxID=53501 RepID=A0A0P1FZI0_THAGE|nr:TetR/AcrR family transcriptional regulator [Thalassovita gelatinovora]QIZ80698.1 TetR/AcrR family transcriptional regulator [Thalassovita gelatinovora]CUH65283.1 HTH-type transcriptional repressor AcnR [Thalassovita gelatinovora]SEQ88791.1 transcriptional regulator, TetR family [Thalassovita gelatinovora]
MDPATKTIIRTGRKFEQVLLGARKVFMADGFEGASVDDIAKAAGVSKATLYSYFPDKRLLFMEVVRSECLRQAEDAVELADFDASPQVALRFAGYAMVDIFTSDFSQRIFRVCVAESDRFPELGWEFYQSGPMVGRARLTEYLKQAVARGELKIDDFALAADQFVELCKADLFARMVFGINRDFTKAEKARVVEAAVDMFIARYGVAP